MPDLGKYASTVLSSYAITVALLAGLVLISVLRARRVRARLTAVERVQKQ